MVEKKNEEELRIANSPISTIGPTKRIGEVWAVICSDSLKPEKFSLWWSALLPQPLVYSLAEQKTTFLIFFQRVPRSSFCGPRSTPKSSGYLPAFLRGSRTSAAQTIFSLSSSRTFLRAKKAQTKLPGTCYGRNVFSTTAIQGLPLLDSNPLWMMTDLPQFSQSAMPRHHQRGTICS